MKIIYIVISAIFLCACSTKTEMEKNKQDLIDADKAFSKLSSEAGMNHAFGAYWAKDGVLLVPGSMPVVGHEAVKDGFRKRDYSALELTWEPLYAMVAKSGDLGYTYGIYSRYYKDSDSTSKGTYVSVWIKEHGKWRFVLDSGNEGVGE